MSLVTSTAIEKSMILSVIVVVVHVEGIVMCGRMSTRGSIWTRCIVISLKQASSIIDG